MTTHLRLADASQADQQSALLSIVRACPILMEAFRTARNINLPDWWIVSGAIYNQVWNHMTDRPDMFGVNDIDLFYFDADTGYDAEDAVIRRAAGRFAENPPVEIRNQARVHLWYEKHFGTAYAPLASSRQAIDRFACQTHCIGLRLCADDDFEMYAPFGLNDIFSFRLVPNTERDNRKTHETKAVRQTKLWPQLTVIPWPK